MIFGSHRSHGEIIAKCCSAMRSVDDDRINHILETFSDGKIMAVVDKHFRGGDIQETSENFILYGLLAEIFGRSTGFNSGMGGSMHAFFVPFESMPNNALVGGSADIGLGAALFKKVNRQEGIVVVNIGDGAMGCGPVWETLCMASMDQYHTLWGGNEGSPPRLFYSI